MIPPNDAIALNRAAWNTVARKFYGGTALPNYGPLTPTEDTLGLLGRPAGQRVLELGCGSGHSLRYLGERGAEELWGLDVSSTQIAFAAEVLRSFQPRVHLVESPMEVDPGIPENHFDLVFSIYGLGWTTDLPATLALVYRYLKPGGVFVFSGEHPAYRSLEYADGHYVFSTSYSAEGATLHDAWNGAPTVIQHRTLGTIVTAIARAGLRVEALIEGELDTAAATDAHHDPARWYSVPRARLVPTTFIVEARKP